MPQKEITIKIKPEVILGQQLATQADEFLEIIDDSLKLKPVTGGRMIMREQEAVGVGYLCAKHGHISVACLGLKLGGPQSKVERIGSWYQSTVNMQNLPKLYKIRKKPILDPGAMMHQWAGTGIWHCNMPKNAQKQQHMKVARNKLNRNWHSSRCNGVETVNQLFGAHEVEIKQRKLEALRLLRQADHALDKVCKYFDDLTKDV